MSKFSDLRFRFAIWGSFEGVPVNGSQSIPVGVYLLGR